MAIVEAAAASGAHAIKLQTYTADGMTIAMRDGEFFIGDEASLWQGKSLHELYTEASTPFDWHQPIMQRAAELGLICFSTPFDEAAVDFLEELSVPAYKIASFENVHLPLVRKAAATGKPLIVSTGMATLAEIDEVVCAAREAGCNDLVLLKCTSAYPALLDDANLATIPHLRETFRCEVGLSDHTLGLAAPVSAVVLGATVIEKHFTLSRSDGGVDSAFSIEPPELRQLVTETSGAWRSLGRVNYGPTEAERRSLVFRRSLYISEDLAVGDVLTTENLRIIRPGRGLAPKYFEVLLGKRVNRPVKRGTPMTWDLIG